jgi:hypothetical protein
MQNIKIICLRVEITHTYLVFLFDKLVVLLKKMKKAIFLNPDSFDIGNMVDDLLSGM